MAQIQEQAINIQGPAGNIEAKLAEPEGCETIVVIAHPHPLYQGTMNNKVVTTIASACQRQGMGSLRFNFRGAGNSEGQHASGVGERMDLLAILSWLERERTELDIALGGFSFGAAMVAAVACLHPVLWVITVAPPVDKPYWPVLPTKSSWYDHWLVIQGQQDEIVDPNAVEHYWSENLRKQPTLRLVDDCGHFFHGKLIQLRQIIESWIGVTE